ncbi:ABC transporter substrate-binding protein [Pyramidobacter sp.]|uniref:ABC transporter substrate-binding protein n=1 Tax=Pyramidobacter sp. TaxID=1943581 RepID=UPI0025FA2A76|nr:ABC transporter substrate-binding protein [Pyramidobacter sp.]MCI7404552.1 ABC transporter substrate-binding protein [Pyramidobacter sp.]MDY3213361.1 ABC transporter substrate-binding protein [Pyramidobacter sp.]
MKRFFASFLAAALCSAALAGAAAAAERETITLVDDRGVEVTFPKNPQRIVISSILPLTSVYCLYRGGVQNLVGIPAAAMSAARHSYLAKVYPDILTLECDFAKGGKVNVEEVMKLHPDVVFYRANEVAEGDMYRKAGLPAVAFSTSKHGVDTIATFAGWIERLDQIFGGGGQTSGIAEYGRETLEKLRIRTASLKPEQRPRAIVFSGFRDGQLAAAGGTIFAEFYINEGGGVNVASALNGSKTVNLEQVYAWDPEVIFINNFCPYVPEDFYANAIKGYDWSSVSAVKNRRVYKFPLGMYRWYPPAGDAPLSLLWAAKCLQPELFGDVDMAQAMKDYYRRFYGYDLSDGDVEYICAPPREAAVY